MMGTMYSVNGKIYNNEREAKKEWIYCMLINEKLPTVAQND